MAELEATPPHLDPPVLSYQFEEQQRKLDREMMYLMNKVKSRPPPKPKPPNATNATNASTDGAPSKKVEVYDSMYICVPKGASCRGSTCLPFHILLIFTFLLAYSLLCVNPG